MNKAKVISITDDCIKFDNGAVLFSDHDQDCCESHELYFRDLTLSEFDGLEFDLSGEGFFKRIDGYGIELIPIQGHSEALHGSLSLPFVQIFAVNYFVAFFFVA